MNSVEIKTKVLYYWRFNRKGYDYIATEVGKFNSDILVSNSREIIECEIKTSKYDLKNDFKKTSRSGIPKHSLYANPTKYYSQWIPNKFYFAVDEDLVDYALDSVKDTPYGVILVSSKKIIPSNKDTYCKIIRKADIIQPSFKKKLHRQIILRESSELIRLRMKLL